MFGEFDVVARDTMYLVQGNPNSHSVCFGSSRESWDRGVMQVGHCIQKLSAVSIFRVPGRIG